MMDDKPLRVLHILNGLGFGGAETWLLEIIRFNKGRVQFEFLLTGGEEKELDKFFLEHGCKIHYLKYSARGIIPFVRAFNRVIKQGKFDAVHDHEDFIAGWHWLFLLFNLPPVRIAHAHNSTIFIKNYANSAGRKFFYKAGKWLNGLLSTHITGTSNKLMTELGYDRPFYLKKRIEPLYCSSDPSLFRFDVTVRKAKRAELGLSENDRMLLFVGRIGLSREHEVNHKNPQFAFEIAKKMAESDRAYRFYFVGEKGKTGQLMEDEVSRLQLNSQIVFTGKRRDVPQLMMAADALLFTSTLEPFGVVLVEAQFSGLPLIASDIITRETMLYPELFVLLDVNKANIIEWTNAIRSKMEKLSDRASFIADNANEIDNCRYTTESSYNRLLKYYTCEK